MDHSDWASEHLQVIRTVMERSAVYRRALAPIMLVAGLIGIAGANAACFVELDTNREFSLFWLSIGVLATIAGLLLVRRQALKDVEPFWTLPTRRVSQAVLPAFFAGLIIGVIYAKSPKSLPESAWLLPITWMACYGCALHAAGFSMPRGIRLFGWSFVIGSLFALVLSLNTPRMQTAEAAHYVMGIFFGAAHLAYGIYLYFTERSRRT
jgi:peptidoglycan/LPS O-acetylase OafA/YrhL